MADAQPFINRYYWLFNFKIQKKKKPLEYSFYFNPFIIHIQYHGNDKDFKFKLANRLLQQYCDGFDVYIVLRIINS